MVQRRKTLIWSVKSGKQVADILRFYTERNKSDMYSRKLSEMFISTMDRVALMPYIGKQTEKENVRCVIVREFKIFYEVKSITVEVLYVRDSRQNPKNNPFKEL